MTNFNLTQTPFVRHAPIFAAVLALAAGTADATVICAKKTAKGVIKNGAPMVLRNACQKKEQVVNLASVTPEFGLLVTTTNDRFAQQNQQITALSNNGNDQFAQQNQQITALSNNGADFQNRLTTQETSQNQLTNQVNDLQQQIGLAAHKSYHFEGKVPDLTLAKAAADGVLAWKFIEDDINVNTVSISGAAGKKLTGVAVAALRLNGTDADIAIDLCYQSSGGTVTPFAGNSDTSPYLVVTATATLTAYPITDVVTLPTDVVDPVKVGYCAATVQTDSDVNLFDNDYVSGIIGVTAP